MHDNILTIIITISFLSLLCQYISWWVKIPSILFLLITGLILGPVMGFLDSSLLLGDLFYPIVSLSVAIILFEGSLSLKFKKIKEQKKYIIKFISLGGMITFVGVSFACYYIFSTSILVSFLIGAILTVTGPTVIAPMLRVIRPSTQVCEVAKWEGIVLDPFGAILAVLVFDFMLRGSASDVLTHGLLAFVMMVATGALVGLVFGLFLSQILLKHIIPKFLVNIAVLNFVLLAFLASNQMFHETGLLAVTIMGITLANRSGLDLHEIIEFKETLSTLLISALFILLAAEIKLETLYPLIVPSLILFLVMLLVIRPLKVLVTTRKTDLTLADKFMIVWIAPRGIVAVAIASLFQHKLTDIGYEGVELITPVIFLIIVWSVLLPSLTGKILAKLFGSVQPEQNTILILGANSLSISVAKELLRSGSEVVLIDNVWNEVTRAKHNGINAVYTNLISLDTEIDLNINAVGHVLSLTANSEFTTFANILFKRVVEKKNIYSIKSDYSLADEDSKETLEQFKPRVLFSDEVSYEKLSSMLKQGYKIESIKLTEHLTYENYLKHSSDSILLFALDQHNSLYVVASDTSVKPQPGWTIISITQSKS